jgi:hypothetical protein
MLPSCNFKVVPPAKARSERKIPADVRQRINENFAANAIEKEKSKKKNDADSV